MAKEIYSTMTIHPSLPPKLFIEAVLPFPHVARKWPSSQERGTRPANDPFTKNVSIEDLIPSCPNF